MDTTLLLLLVLAALPGGHSQDTTATISTGSGTPTESASTQSATTDSPIVPEGTISTGSETMIEIENKKAMFTDSPMVTEGTTSTESKTMTEIEKETSMFTESSNATKEVVLLPERSPLCLADGVCQRVYKGSCVYGDISRCMGVVPVDLAPCSDQWGSRCRCCVKCPYRACSSSGFPSVCRSECLEDEFVQYTVTLERKCADHCKCCESCRPTRACRGRCIGNSKLCDPDTEYVEKTCVDPCSCCTPCKADPKCERRGGICFNANIKCPCGYMRTSDAGCNGGPEHCQCCVPCCTSPECTGQPDVGVCVPDMTFCNARDEYISNERCCLGSNCLYCKTCKPQQSCSEEGGKCIRKGNSCGRGMVQSETGECSSCQCICCVPDPCPDSCACLTQPNPGICQIPGHLPCNEYTTNECIGRGCLCHRSCTPDKRCSEMGGSCFNAATGCSDGFIKADKAKAFCHDSRYCVCCLPRIVIFTTEQTSGSIKT